MKSSPGAARKWLYGKLFRLLRMLLHRLGAKTTMLGLASGRNAGMRVQWRPDEPGVLRGAIVPVEVAGEVLRFFVADDFDTVQSCHRRGEIYEPEELALIARHFAGGIVVDVGANVGNHAIFMARIAGAKRVVAFEPEPLAARLCRVNLALNGCEDRVELFEIGLSDAEGSARAVLTPGDLGSTRLGQDGAGPLQLATGDRMLAGRPVDFLKIDTEGFELRVLDGLREAIARCRPSLFVEVENENRADFERFCRQADYSIAEEFRRYDECTNLLALPCERR